MSDISEKGSDFVKELGDAARRNPVSAALIGMGIFWLFTGGRTAHRVGNLVKGAGLRPHSRRCWKCDRRRPIDPSVRCRGD